MDRAEVAAQLEALSQYDEAESAIREKGAVTYHMERRTVLDGEGEGQWIEPTSLSTQPYIANPVETVDPSQMASPPLNGELVDGYSGYSADFKSDPFTMANQQFSVAGNQFDFNSNKCEAVDTKIEVMNHSMVPQPFVDPTTPCTPPLTPMDTVSPCDFPQQVYSQSVFDGTKMEDYATTDAVTAVMPPSNGMLPARSRYDNTTMVGYPVTDAATAVISPFDSMQQYSSTPIDGFPPSDAAPAAMNNSGQMRIDSSPTYNHSSPNQHSKIEFADYSHYEASCMLIPQNRHLLNSTTREHRPIESKRPPNVLVAVPSNQWKPSEYNGLDRIFDFAIANPLPLIQVKPVEKVEQRKKCAPPPIKDGGPIKSLPVSAVEESTPYQRSTPCPPRKKHTHFKNAGEEERIMRDFMANDDLNCPFECSKKTVSMTNKRGHLKKYHYGIYFKYCRSKRSMEEEVKERHLGALKGDRLCLICDAQFVSQKDMAKHLEKNHKLAFDRYQKEVETARERDLAIYGGKRKMD